MTVRKLNQDTGDIETSGTQFIGGREEIAQTIQTRLRLFLGEYFRDIQDGTPWFQQILGKFSNLNIAEALLRNRILETEGVVKLLTFSMDYGLETRKLTVTSSVLTTYGDLEIVYDGTINESGISIN